MSVVVEDCTNVNNPAWSPLQTNTLRSDTSYFSDPQLTNYPFRFYRPGRHKKFVIVFMQMCGVRLLYRLLDSKAQVKVITD